VATTVLLAATSAGRRRKEAFGLRVPVVGHSFA
jgi:hypothetical protein